MTRARDELLDALRAAMEEVSPGNALVAAFERPRQAAHGDLACTAAMPLGKAQRRKPREVATELIAALREGPNDSGHSRTGMRAVLLERQGELLPDEL
jgi:arginyl-tRNA synthetase